MSDLISRDDLLAAYDAAHKGPPGGARKLIAEAPAIDAAPVRHGRWWKKTDWHPISYTATKDFPFYECTQCGWNRRFAIDYNFCPNCGAKMDVTEDA